jgi:hypothetical protein
MTTTRNRIVHLLVTVMLIGTAFIVSLTYNARVASNAAMTVDAEVYEDAKYTLKGFLGMKDEGTSGVLTRNRKSKDEGKVVDSDGARLTQRVTIVSDTGVLPITGTVTKVQDVYYPGTYELKFGNNAILTEDASIYVSINVKEGDMVYILTGDRENGYVEYQVVRADKDNMISFGTSVIRDYTISTTDIISAQEAMASLVNR